VTETVSFRSSLSRCKNLVIKVGTAVLARNVGADCPAEFDGSVFLDLVQSVADLLAQGHRVSLVSSGAILSGMIGLGHRSRPRLLPEKQACAAVGQIELMARYKALFDARGIRIGQLLLTADDCRRRQRFLNARNTVLALLKRGILPIINENDTVSVDEIKLGDNDNLSSLVINLVGADLLLLLSDVDGIFTSDPKRDPTATRIPTLSEGAPEFTSLATGAGKGVGTGGIATKLAAASKAMALGVPAVIACGKVRGIVPRILAGEDLGTVFIPKQQQLSPKKHWMAFAPRPRGRILVDEGAARALQQGKKSLLPSGVIGAEGEFAMGDLVGILGPDNQEVARGLSNYSAVDVRRIQGARSSDIERILGRKDFDEVVHRDNMVVSRSQIVTKERS